MVGKGADEGEAGGKLRKGVHHLELWASCNHAPLPLTGSQPETQRQDLTLAKGEVVVEEQAVGAKGGEK